MLAGVVEHRGDVGLAVREGDDLFERLALQIGVLLDEAVQRRHIRLMVLAVMQLQRLLAHAFRCECVGAVGKGGSSKAIACFLRADQKLRLNVAMDAGPQGQACSANLSVRRRQEHSFGADIS